MATLEAERDLVAIRNFDPGVELDVSARAQGQSPPKVGRKASHSVHLPSVFGTRALRGGAAVLIWKWEVGSWKMERPRFACAYRSLFGKEGYLLDFVAVKFGDGRGGCLGGDVAGVGDGSGDFGGEV